MANKLCYWFPLIMHDNEKIGENKINFLTNYSQTLIIFLLLGLVDAYCINYKKGTQNLKLIVCCFVFRIVKSL